MFVVTQSQKIKYHTWLYNFAWLTGDDQLAAIQMLQHELEAT